MNRLQLLIVGLVFAAMPASAAVLEVPQSGGDASGIGYISGWKCPPNDKITIVIDGGDPIPVPSGVRRGDTAGACGNDGRNGFITQMNFGLLGGGFHTVAVRQNGQTFTTSTFNVTTFGTPFLTGASGSYTLLDFPTKGKTVDIDWNQGTQSFVVTGTGGGGPGNQCPTTGPATNLQVDCSDFVFFYDKGGVSAGISSDGDLAAICAVSITSTDVLCFGGPVSSPTAFALTLGNVNGGPFSALDPGSGGNISANGQTLNFTIKLQGQTFPFLGLAYNGRDTLGGEVESASIGHAASQLLATMRSSGADVAAATGANMTMASDLAAIMEQLGQ